MFWKKKEKDYKEVLKDVPGPSPWYIRSCPLKLDGFCWDDAPDGDGCSGISILKNKKDEILALFDFQNYVSLLPSGEFFIWHQPYDSHTPTDIECIIVHPNSFVSLGKEIKPLCHSLRANKRSILIKSPTKVNFRIPTIIVNEVIQYDFPSQLKQLEEFFMFCHSSGIADTDGGRGGKIGLLVAKPKENIFQIYPQDWFNNGGFDYGYQWLTRAARSTKDKKIYGEGVRISPFRLDETMRNIDKNYS